MHLTVRQTGQGRPGFCDPSNKNIENNPMQSSLRLQLNRVRG